jgi:hypothetical protein
MPGPRSETLSRRAPYRAAAHVVIYIKGLVTFHKVVASVKPRRFSEHVRSADHCARMRACQPHLCCNISGRGQKQRVACDCDLYLSAEFLVGRAALFWTQLLAFRKLAARGWPFGRFDRTQQMPERLITASGQRNLPIHLHIKYQDQHLNFHILSARIVDQLM